MFVKTKYVRNAKSVSGEIIDTVERWNFDNRYALKIHNKILNKIWWTRIKISLILLVIPFVPSIPSFVPSITAISILFKIIISNV